MDPRLARKRSLGNASPLANTQPRKVPRLDTSTAHNTNRGLTPSSDFSSSVEDISRPTFTMSLTMSNSFTQVIRCSSRLGASQLQREIHAKQLEAATQDLQSAQDKFIAFPSLADAKAKAKARAQKALREADLVLQTIEHDLSKELEAAVGNIIKPMQLQAETVMSLQAGNNTLKEGLQQHDRLLKKIQEDMNEMQTRIDKPIQASVDHAAVKRIVNDSLKYESSERSNGISKLQQQLATHINETEKFTNAVNTKLEKTKLENKDRGETLKLMQRTVDSVGKDLQRRSTEVANTGSRATISAEYEKTLKEVLKSQSELKSELKLQVAATKINFENLGKNVADLKPHDATRADAKLDSIGLELSQTVIALTTDLEKTKKRLEELAEEARRTPGTSQSNEQVDFVERNDQGEIVSKPLSLFDAVMQLSRKIVDQDVYVEERDTAMTAEFERHDQRLAEGADNIKVINDNYEGINARLRLSEIAMANRHGSVGGPTTGTQHVELERDLERTNVLMQTQHDRLKKDLANTTALVQIKHDALKQDLDQATAPIQKQYESIRAIEKSISELQQAEARAAKSPRTSMEEVINLTSKHDAQTRITQSLQDQLALLQRQLPELREQTMASHDHLSRLIHGQGQESRNAIAQLQQRTQNLGSPRIGGPVSGTFGQQGLAQNAHRVPTPPQSRQSPVILQHATSTRGPTGNTEFNGEEKILLEIQNLVQEIAEIKRLIGVNNDFAKLQLGTHEQKLHDFQSKSVAISESADKALKDVKDLRTKFAERSLTLSQDVVSNVLETATFQELQKKLVTVELNVNKHEDKAMKLLTAIKVVDEMQGKINMCREDIETVQGTTKDHEKRIKELVENLNICGTEVMRHNQQLDDLGEIDLVSLKKSHEIYASRLVQWKRSQTICNGVITGAVNIVERALDRAPTDLDAKIEEVELSERRVVKTPTIWS